MQSEVEMQFAEHAKRRIQDLMTNTLVDCSGSPKYLWFLRMLDVIQVLYCLADHDLGTRTPNEKAIGYTDILHHNCVLCDQPVFFLLHRRKDTFSRQ